MANNTMLINVPYEYEPKRKNRFFAEFPSELGIEVWQVRDFDRPKLEINSVEIPYMNEHQYVSGKYKWQTLNVEFIDPIGPSTSQQLMEWVRMHAESLTGRMGYAQGYKKDLVLKELDPAGVPVSRFLIEQAMITNIDFNDHSYGDDELTTISLTIQPWRCILNF